MKTMLGEVLDLRGAHDIIQASKAEMDITNDIQQARLRHRRDSE